MSQELRLEIAKKIKELRIKLGIKREELSLKINRDNSYISKLERGRINFTIDGLEKIANALSVSVKCFFIEND